MHYKITKKQTDALAAFAAFCRRHPANDGVADLVTEVARLIHIGLDYAQEEIPDHLYVGYATIAHMEMLALKPDFSRFKNVSAAVRRIVRKRDDNLSTVDGEVDELLLDMLVDNKSFVTAAYMAGLIEWPNGQALWRCSPATRAVLRRQYG